MFLGLDLGTTNVKAVATDRNGGVLAEAAHPVVLYQVKDGGVEQDLEEIWRAACATLAETVRAIDARRVQALGVSSQGGALQLLDGHRRPAGRVVSWLDQRGEAAASALENELGSDWFVARTGHRRAWVAAGQLLRLAKESPELLRPPRAVGFVGDLIVERLCGEAVQDGTSAALSLLYDPVQRRYATDLLDRVGLRPGQLPTIKPSDTEAGSLLPGIAAALGLPAGIPVSPAIHDQYAAALSTGTLEAGKVMVGTGTAWVLLAISQSLPFPLSGSSLICHHLLDGLYGQIISLVNGGSALHWVLELMGLSEIEPGELERLLGSAPPGCDGLFFWPFLTPFGAAGLPPGTRGRLSGIQLGHGRGHVVRAVLEGLACELKRHLLILEKSGTAVRELIVAGKAASSPFVSQLLSDMANVPLACSGANSGSAHGAAILARRLVEPNRSLADCSREMRPKVVRVKPGKNASVYQAQFTNYLTSLPITPQNS